MLARPSSVRACSRVYGHARATREPAAAARAYRRTSAVSEACPRLAHWANGALPKKGSGPGNPSSERGVPKRAAQSRPLAAGRRRSKKETRLKPRRSTLLAAGDQHALTRPSQPSGRTFKWRSLALLTSTSRALTAHWCGV
ncbi:hypothetical protein HPB52_014584 [Rhipicephalus sanguineus]|uniref:Uncharacterized protein n=1 Tax=Rhipicephalus sanguineus TaxID=34632 RepID=A0A9D4TAG3_RHISA|nr:hypothetical protein HPB52_014584 [Rhipicephalus sanguineus]